MLSRLNWRLVFPHAVLVILAGCSDDDSPSNAVPADKSLAVADYIQRGLPAIDRPWSGSDMRTAHKMFADKPEPTRNDKYPSSHFLFSTLN